MGTTARESTRAAEAPSPPPRAPAGSGHPADDTFANAPCYSLDAQSGAEIGERILHFLLAGPDGAHTIRGGSVHADSMSDGSVVLDFDDGQRTVKQRLSPEKVRSLQAGQQRTLFDADEHVAPGGIKMEDHEETKTPAARADAQELEGQRKAAADAKKVEADDELVQLRHEVESVDTESHLDTPDFSDGEDEWVVAKSK